MNKSAKEMLAQSLRQLANVYHQIAIEAMEAQDAASTYEAVKRERECYSRLHRLDRFDAI